MRPTRIALLLFLLLLGLWGCRGGSDSGNASAPIAVSASPVLAEATPAATPMAVPTPEPTPTPVQILGQSFAADTETLTVPGQVEDSEQLREALAQLPALTAVTAERLIPEADIAGWNRGWTALTEAYPAVSFTFHDLYGGAAAETVESLTPPAMPDGAEMEAIRKIFVNLNTLDLRALDVSREQAAALAARAPDVNVLWTDTTFGPSESAWEEVILSAQADTEAVKTYLGCFPGLKEADLLGTGLTEAEGDALWTAFPNVALRRMVTLNGQTYDSFTERIDLSNAWISEYDAFAEAVGRFPKLRSLDLSDCSLKNEKLAELRDRYPEAGVVWVVRFGRWACRTDAVAFSTLQSSYTNSRLMSSYASVLRYCTDLIALDLGHNALDDISWLEALPNLQLLILADNRIKDITPLASLKKLKYVELFMNPLRDIAPLGSLPELLDVNLCITYVQDLSPLLSCSKLERIWIGHQTQDFCTKESLQALREAFPEAEYDLTSVSCTNLGWREHPRFYAYQEMFRTNTAVAPFLPEG